MVTEQALRAESPTGVTLRSVVSMFMVGAWPYDQALAWCEAQRLNPETPIARTR